MQNHVLDYLDEIVKKVPEKTAYADDEVSLTFRETDEISRSIGTWLSKQGIYRQPVVVFMKKSPRTIATFFGVIQSGCFYVPIDAEMPADRMHLILENCRAEMLICDEETLEAAKQLKYSGRIVQYQEICGFPAEDTLLAGIRAQALDIDPVYILFTSGSTGVPKGVCACHRSVLDYVEQLSDVMGFSENTVFGNQTPLYVDACLKELYPTLKFGATTYLIPHSCFLFPIKLVEYLNEKRINTICWVASALIMVSAFGTFETVRPEYLRTVAFGSEVFPLKQFCLWKEALPEAKFVNLYGPTEGTGVCCHYTVTRDLEENEPIPIGFPFKNTQILLLNEENRLAEDGEEGEICIRGTGVTLGYYNNPERTSESFVQNPLNTSYPEIIYQTGDIGRRNKYGELVFVSRRDYQIKHMGHRIELGEIEADVNLLEAVKMSACIYDTEKNKIILYYVGSETPAEITGRLKEKLPRYMLPNKVVQMEQLPFTANGKIDRKTLQKNYQEKNKKG